MKNFHCARNPVERMKDESESEQIYFQTIDLTKNQYLQTQQQKNPKQFSQKMGKSREQAFQQKTHR